MRATKQYIILVILTTAVFFFTYMYIFSDRKITKVPSYDPQLPPDDDQKLSPIHVDSDNTEKEPTPIIPSLEAKREKPNVPPLIRSHLDTNHNQKLQKNSSKPELTTPLPPTGLANSSLIGSFNESLSFLINWPHKCHPDNGKYLLLLIVVISAINKRDDRDAIRQTWGADALKRGAQIVFLTGRGLTPEESLTIVKENEQFRDIVQTNFDDVYYNMTLKSVCMVKWAFEYCRNVKFVFKVDGDMFINSALLLAFAEANLHLRKTIIGSLWPGGKPIRTKGRWYVSMSVYPYRYYPTYVSGGAYLITGDSVPLLYETSLRIPTFLFEDVLMAGMVAEKAGVRRLNAVQISVNHFEVEETCKFREFISAHNYRPDVVIELWKRLNRRDIKCPSVTNKNHTIGQQ